MNKLSLFLLLSFFVLSSFNGPEINTTNKVEAIFSETFKDVKNLQWYVNDNTYSARFTTKGVITSITYDKDGKFVRSSRAGNEDLLPVNILTKIKEKYRGKIIKLVVEIAEGDELSYSLTIEDEVNCWLVEATPSGNNKVLSKFRKQ